MYRDYKIVAFVPAGREQVLKVLSKNLMRFQGVLDRVQLWRNTEDEEDLAYIDQLGRNPLFDVIPYPEGEEWHGPSNDQPIQLNTGRWYKQTIEPDTIYVRFDDDIVYIHDDYFKNILDFRIDNPEYFLVFGNIWNNAIISYYQQQEGNIDTDHGVVEKPYCMDMIGWGDPYFAEYIHTLLLKKIEEDKVEDLYIDNYPLETGHRFSISNFCFFGKDFAKFNGELDQDDEEIWLTGTYPKRKGFKNIICGNALVSHLTFSPYQKQYILEDTDIAERYEELSEELLSKGYYNLLNKKVK